MKQKELEDFKKSLLEKNKEELVAMEEAVMKEAEDHNKHLAELEYDLPKENYKEVAEAICYFLNKQSVQWQYTLGMFSMYDFWAQEKPHKKIPYPHLDSLLNTLGGLQFTGVEEWSRVIAINKYFEPLRDKYVTEMTKTYDIADRHSAIIEAEQLMLAPADKK